MNNLTADAQTMILSALVEGNSIRSTERMTGVHRDTITKLLMRVGEGCAYLIDATMRNLPCQHVQVDEIWAFVGKKQRHLTADDDVSRMGDMWTWVALDADTKLVPCYRVSKRTARDARTFIADLESRVAGRVQLSSDALSLYVEAAERAFGTNVDYGQIVKSYEAEAIGPGRYSPPHVVSVERTPVSGSPDPSRICTSHVERQNLTMRMSMRRFTRLTNGFSKRYENLRAAVAVHFGWYNFVRVHRSLRVTPAMEAGIVNNLWTIRDLLYWAEKARVGTV